jgi:hypothetical protein
MSDESRANNHLNELTSQKDAFIFYFKKLDIEMIDLILDGDKTYQDFPKTLFIQKLDNAFYRFLKKGDSELYSYQGTCCSQICSFDCKGIRFIGNNSGLYIDLVFKEEKGNLLDVYECHQFSTVSPKKDLSQKVFIDSANLPISMM